MTRAATKARAAAVYARLEQCYPAVRCTLTYRSPFELLIMTMLAAQCTDARVNVVAPGLFRKFPRPASFLAASQEIGRASCRERV